MNKYTLEERSTSSTAGEKRRSYLLWGNGVNSEFRDTDSPSWSGDVVTVLKTTFLPVGYPDSVRPEYLTYQFWDSLQGMSSYLRSVLTTRSVLAGAGVGSVETTALTAALTWVFRDGLGMIGSLLFAYKYSSTFEIYIKEWRYLADILNNVGLTLDLLSADFPQHYFVLTSISTLCKACCGLIAGATKARISAHFAMPGHLADVTAKESTQETAVALVGLVVGMLLAQLIGNDDRSVWITFTVLLLLHQYSNYHLVKVLIFNNLNPQRCFLLAQLTNTKALSNTAKEGSSKSSKSPQTYFPSPAEVAAKETFITPIYLTYFGPEVGCSLQCIIDTIQFIVCNRSGTFTADHGWDIQPHRRAENGCGFDATPRGSILHSNVAAFFGLLGSCWEKESFIIGVDMNGRVIACLKVGVTKESIVKAYMVAYYIFVRLDVSVALYGAKKTSKHRYLTELYAYLVGRLAAEALHWYDTHTRNSTAKPIASATNASHIKTGQSEVNSHQDEWNLSEVASLSVGEWRYSEVVAKEE